MLENNILSIYSNTIDYSVKFTIGDQVCAELKKIGTDKHVELPIYNLDRIDEISTLVNGKYAISDIVMPVFIDLVSDRIVKYFSFKNNCSTDLIDVRYFSPTQETDFLFFISDNTLDEEINILTKKQAEFASIYHDFSCENGGIIWEDTIGVLQQAGYLTDFLCVLNIERKLLGVLS